MANIKLLKKYQVFSGLTSESLTAISQRAFQREYPEGKLVVIEGMTAEFCYFIISGTLRVSRMNKEGRIQILARLGKGAPVNIISLLKKEKLNHASVECLTPANLLVINKKDFDYLLENLTDFSTALLKIFAERIAKITDLAADLSLYTVRARLAQFLIELADQPQLAGGWTQDEIAAHIGTVRDVVGRLLREFEGQGVIKREHHQIILLDKEALLKAAEIFE